MALTNVDGTLQEVVKVASDDKSTIWEATKKLFLRTFNTVTDKAEAQQKLFNLKQGSRTVEEFVTEFKMLKVLSEVDDNTSMVFFKNALKDVIRMKIYESGEIPEELNEWIERAKAIDYGWRESQLFKTQFKPTQAKTRFMNNQGNRPKLSEEEFKKRREEKSCFKCGKKGHFARECRSQIRQAEVQELTLEKEEVKQDFA